MGEIYNGFRWMMGDLSFGSTPVILQLRMGEYTFAVHNHPKAQTLAPAGCDEVRGAACYKLHVWRNGTLIGIASRGSGEDTITTSERPRLWAALEAQINSQLPSNKL